MKDYCISVIQDQSGNAKIFVALIGVVAGALGYWISTFWMKPILTYKELKTKIAADFIYYAQVTNADNLNERMKELYEERILANRRNSSDLAACLIELPWLYRRWLAVKGQKPENAVRHLIGYSNTTDYDEAAKLIAAIKSALGIHQLQD